MLLTLEPNNTRWLILLVNLTWINPKEEYKLHSGSYMFFVCFCTEHNNIKNPSKSETFLTLILLNSHPYVIVHHLQKNICELSTCVGFIWFVFARCYTTWWRVAHMCLWGYVGRIWKICTHYLVQVLNIYFSFYK